VESGCTGTVTPNTLPVLPGGTGSAVLAVTSPTGTSTGSYNAWAKVFDNLVAAHTASASVTDVVDSTPPPAPTNLTYKVRGAKVQLSWGAATDSVGVSSYVVVRNGAQIGSTAGTGYTDGSTTNGGSYTYYVVALDKAGNRSAASNTVTVKR
jgi:fibronectin type 3 domain-containing protein